MDLRRAYAEAARITRKRARNFYFAFLSLPPAQRRSVYALYAFCREADDIADGPESVEDKRLRLSRLRLRLDRAASGDPLLERDAPLADTIAVYGVRPTDLHEVITGVETDLDFSPIQTFAELRLYCYRVAAAVGLATLPILTDGSPPNDEMKDSAEALGIGMQLVNIIRDIAEDLRRGRNYIPAEDLRRFGLSEEDLRRGRVSEPIRRLIAWESDRARRYLEEGAGLIRLLPQRSRSCPWLLSQIYGRILTRIEDSGYDVFSGSRSLPTGEKVYLLVSSYLRRF